MVSWHSHPSFWLAIMPGTTRMKEEKRHYFNSTWASTRSWNSASPRRATRAPRRRADHCREAPPSREAPGSKYCTGYLPDWAFAYLDNILRLTVNLLMVSWLGQVDCSKASLAKRLPQGPLTTPNSQVFFGGQYFLLKLVSASKVSRRNLPVIFDNSWRWQGGR